MILQQVGGNRTRTICRNKREDTLKMASQIGEILREWRVARRLTLGALAVKAGVHPSTLSRWEASRRQPSLQELEVTLKALGVSASQRREALRHIEAPRAVQRIRKEEGDGPPVGGDLLRAMRLRRGWTQAETAACIGVTQSVLAKWERSEDWPAAERLHALCYTLQAHPEETTALTQGRFWLSSEADVILSQEQCRQRLLSIYLHLDGLRDLRFLSLEAQLWHRAAAGGFAAPLLRLTYAYHARALMEMDRFAEAGGFLARLQQRPPAAEEYEETFPQAVIVAATAAGRRRPRRAIQILNAALPNVRHVEYRSWMMSDLGTYLAQVGQGRAAAAVSEEACRVAQGTAECSTLWFRRRDQARTLTVLKRYGAALTALEAASPLLEFCADSQARYRLLEAECLLELGKPSEAQRRLSEASTTIAGQNLHYLRSQQNTLAQRL